MADTGRERLLLLAKAKAKRDRDMATAGPVSQEAKEMAAPEAAIRSGVYGITKIPLTDVSLATSAPAALRAIKKGIESGSLEQAKAAYEANLPVFEEYFKGAPSRDWPEVSKASEFAGEVINPLTGAAVKSAMKVAKPVISGAAKTIKKVGGPVLEELGEAGKWAARKTGVELEGTIEKGANKFRELTEKHATSVISGFSTTTQKMLDKILPGKYEFALKRKELGKFAIDNDILKNTGEDTAKAALELKRETGATIGKILEEGKGPAIDVSEDVFAPIKKAMDAKKINAPQSLANAYDGVTKEFAYLQHDRWKSAKDLWEIRDKFDESINWGKIKDGTAEALDKAKVAAREIIDDVIDKRIEKNLGLDSFETYKGLKTNYVKAMAIEKMAAKTAGGEGVTSKSWYEMLPELAKAGFPGPRAIKFATDKEARASLAQKAATIASKPAVPVGRAALAATDVYAEEQQ